MHVWNAGEFIAMQTAQALVREESESRVRVLFDSGNNKSFVTQGVKQLINPKVKRKEWLHLNTCGKSLNVGKLLSLNYVIFQVKE